eukprot:Hpha_TRINITY_DN21254_c0_g1::TRINITY_DN21254_c0_g1_i1::g.171571::m.171571
MQRPPGKMEWMKRILTRDSKGVRRGMLGKMPRNKVPLIRPVSLQSQARRLTRGNRRRRKLGNKSNTVRKEVQGEVVWVVKAPDRKLGATRVKNEGGGNEG